MGTTNLKQKSPIWTNKDFDNVPKLAREVGGSGTLRAQLQGDKPKWPQKPASESYAKQASTGQLIVETAKTTAKQIKQGYNAGMDKALSAGYNLTKKIVEAKAKKDAKKVTEVRSKKVAGVKPKIAEAMKFKKKNKK